MGGCSSEGKRMSDFEQIEQIKIILRRDLGCTLSGESLYCGASMVRDRMLETLGSLPPTAKVDFHGLVILTAHKFFRYIESEGDR